MVITIDNQFMEVKEGQTILEASLSNGHYNPHLCKHPDLEAAGGCRLCMVHIQGQDKPVPACETMVESGMVIQTDSEDLKEIRRISMELMLASHPSECKDCPKYGNCELQSLYQYFNASAENWRMKVRAVAENNENPLIRHQFVRCIRCGRCVRACHSLRGIGVLDYHKQKSDVRIGTDKNQLLIDTDCRFCGACIEVCPTGAITDAIGALDERLPKEQALVPCKNSCPAHIDIPSFLRCAAERDWENALAILRESIPIPGILGSICTHECETTCRHGQINQPISICRMKKVAYEASKPLKIHSEIEKTGKKVAIVGGGPAGISAAYYLKNVGHSPTIYEENEKLGGQLRVGIPAYRLPDQLIDEELDLVLTDVEVICGKTITDPISLLRDGYDAVLVAIGTHQGKRLPLPGADLPEVVLNTDFLKSARRGTPIKAGKNVVVLGGGNVAIDCARTAKRLGAETVTIACLEAVDQMRAAEEEIEEAKEEQVQFLNHVNFVSIEGEDHVSGVKLQKIKDFHFDEQGKAVIVPSEEPEMVINADQVIFAIGQVPKNAESMGLAMCHRFYIQVSNSGETNVPGVFAAGDVVTGTKTVIDAVVAGKNCAAAIDQYFGGSGNVSETLRNEKALCKNLEKRAGFGKEERVCIQMRTPEKRCRDFDTYENMEEELFVEEAKRCLQCDLRLTIGHNRFWNEYVKVENKT